MSGPKTSRYTLTAEQRRILAEQRRILAEQRKIERRKAAAAEIIRQTQQALHQMNGMFRDDMSVAAELSVRTGSDNGFGALIAELNTLISTAQPRFMNTAENDVTSIERAAEKTKKDLASARQLAEKIAALGAQNEKKLKDNLQAVLSKGFSAPPAATRKKAASPCAALQKSTVQRLHEFRKNDALPQTYIAEIDDALTKIQAISSETFLKNTVALVVEPLIKKIGLYMDEYEQYHEEFETLYSEYCALCSLCGEEEKEYVCSRASVEALQAEIDRLQAAIAYDDEQAYISKCLDDVMAEMGYCVLGSREVTKRNGSRFRNKLYSYEEGTAELHHIFFRRKNSDGARRHRHERSHSHGAGNRAAVRFYGAVLRRFPRSGKAAAGKGRCPCREVIASSAQRRICPDHQHGRLFHDGAAQRIPHKKAAQSRQAKDHAEGINNAKI